MKVANVGFAPQIKKKPWASENGPTHYLNSWVKIHPHAFNLTFLKILWNLELKVFVKFSYT